MKGGAKQKPQAVVVTKSPLLYKGIEQTLSSIGFKTSLIYGPKKFVKNPRQRPYVMCFLDARLFDAHKTLSECIKARPAERYVFINPLNDCTDVLGDLNGLDFGHLSECYQEEELLKLARRALGEEQRQEDGPTLEELLFERFSGYLQHTGNSDTQNLYELVSERVDRPLLKAVMLWSNGNQTKASQVLGLHRNTLRAKLKTLGLDKDLG